MSHPKVSTGTFLSLLRVDANEVLVPAPATPPRPYEVRIRESIGNTVTLIGHDGRGQPMAELRTPRRLLNARAVAGMERYCRAHDRPDAPELHLLT